LVSIHSIFRPAREFITTSVGKYALVASFPYLDQYIPTNICSTEFPGWSKYRNGVTSGYLPTDVVMDSLAGLKIE
jgi:hypothetical protein